MRGTQQSKSIAATVIKTALDGVKHASNSAYITSHMADAGKDTSCVEGRVISAFYTPFGSRPQLTYVLRTAEGHKEAVTISSPILPYFFVKVSDAQKIQSADIQALIQEWEEHISLKPENEAILYDSAEPPVRVELTNPENVGRLRPTLEKMGIKVYEADIPFTERVAIDTSFRNHICISGDKIVPSLTDIKPSFKWGDFETKDDQVAELKDSVIRSVAVCNGDTKFFCEEEKDVILKFLNHIKNTDVVCFWNGKLFDVPLLRARTKAHGINLEWRQWRFFDVGFYYKQSNTKQSESWALDFAGQKVLKRGKITRKKLIEELYHTDRKALEEYNTNDAIVLRDVDKELSVSATRQEMADIAGLFIDNVYPSTFVDSLLLRKAQEIKPRVIFGSRKKKKPNRFWSEEDIDELELEEESDNNTYMGGLVIEAPTGLHKRVIELDFNMLYNTIIQSLNVSPESLDPNGEIKGVHVLFITCEEKGDFVSVARFVDSLGAVYDAQTKKREVRMYIKYDDLDRVFFTVQDYLKTLPFATQTTLSKASRFTTKKRGIIPSVLESLTGMRVHYRKLAQEAKAKYGETSNEYIRNDITQNTYKVALNIFYGSMGSRGGRYYSKELAESTPSFGQYIATKSRQLVEQAFGLNVIYQDTDSLFVEVPYEATHEDLLKLSETIIESINKLCYDTLGEHGVPEQWRKIQIKREDIYKSIFWTEAKKRYAGETYEKIRNKVGFEAIRSDWCSAAKDAQNFLIERILDGIDMDTIVQTFVLPLREDVINGKINDKLVLSKSVRRDIESYKKEDAHIKAAKQVDPMQLLLNSKIQFVITSIEKGSQQAKPVINNQIPFIEQDTLKFYYWNRQILPPLDRILRAMNYDTSSLFIEKPRKLRTKVEKPRPEKALTEF